MVVMRMMGVGRKLMGGAVGAAGAAANVARHVAWYLSYQIGRDRR
jgi:hypothetical protein